MVRRWSYLNTLNTQQFFFTTAKPKTLVAGHQTVTFKATTYYRKQLFSPLISKLMRKAFFRRKHLNNWLFYQNILSYWAAEYLFLRRYSRSLLALSFYQNSYLMYNVLVFGKMSAADLSGFESFMVTSLLRSVQNYCNFGATSLTPFTAGFADIAWFHASIPAGWEQIQKDSRLKEDPAYVLAHRSLTPAIPTGSLEPTLSSLFHSFDDCLLQNLVSFYKLVSLLIFYQVTYTK